MFVVYRMIMGDPREGNANIEWKVTVCLLCIPLHSIDILFGIN